MILRTLGEIETASYSDLKQSLAWWLGPKLFIGGPGGPGPRHQKAMVAAIRMELHRRGLDGVPEEAASSSES